MGISQGVFLTLYILKQKNKGNTIFLKEGTSELGLGTGFIVTSEGYIVTNQHVSGDKNSTCYVTLEDGRNYEATVVWADSDIDLSVVKINAKNLEFLKLGDSENIKIAQKVYAIGNPIGYEFQRTVTSGIISGIERTKKKAEKEKRIKEAEGEAEAILKVQQANADGIRFIREAGADQAVLTIKSLEAFEKAADGKATKIIIPSELQSLAGLVKSAKEVIKED